jgi:thiamine kinase-like enzyme
MAGNTSTTSIIEVDGKKIFTKLKKAEEFDLKTFSFQNMLYLMFESDLKINKPLYIQNSISGYVSIRYDVIDEHLWELNNKNIGLLGKYLAELHNFCYEYRDKIKLEKKIVNCNLQGWASGKQSPEKEKSFKQRELIFADLKPYNNNQVTIPVHRDFKVHNILFDGVNFNLIDFDFAAIDNVGIEIMSFIMDFYSRTLQKDLIDTFVEQYKMHSKVPIDWTTIVNDYLVYMCCNTFPFYLRESIGEDNFTELLEERNLKLNLANTLKDKLNACLQG